MPTDKNNMPEDLNFLPDLEACFLPEQYVSSPFESFLDKLYSLPEKINLCILLTATMTLMFKRIS